MSTFVVPVTTVAAVQPHPYATTLDIVLLAEGDQVITARGSHQPDDRVVYIPAGCCIPAELARTLELPVPEQGPVRIKVVRLRGKPSQGLLYVPDPWPVEWHVGCNVAAELAIVPYEAPIPLSMDGLVAPRPHRLHGASSDYQPYTDIEPLLRHPDWFTEHETVVVTEKLHGTNVIMGWVDGQPVVASRGIVQRGLTLLRDPQNVYWRAALQGDILQRLGYAQTIYSCPEIFLYGEILGVQDLHYQLDRGQIAFYAFDVRLFGRYLDHESLMMVLARLGIPSVPVLDVIPYDSETITALASGASQLASHLREGVVVRPILERVSDQGERIIAKVINVAYKQRHKGTEFH